MNSTALEVSDISAIDTVEAVAKEFLSVVEEKDCEIVRLRESVIHLESERNHLRTELARRENDTKELTESLKRLKDDFKAKSSALDVLGDNCGPLVESMNRATTSLLSKWFFVPAEQFDVALELSLQRLQGAQEEFCSSWTEKCMNMVTELEEAMRLELVSLEAQHLQQLEKEEKESRARTMFDQCLLSVLVPAPKNVVDSGRGNSRGFVGSGQNLIGAATELRTMWETSESLLDATSADCEGFQALVVQRDAALSDVQQAAGWFGDRAVEVSREYQAFLLAAMEGFTQFRNALWSELELLRKESDTSRIRYEALLRGRDDDIAKLTKKIQALKINVTELTEQKLEAENRAAEMENEIGKQMKTLKERVLRHGSINHSLHVQLKTKSQQEVAATHTVEELRRAVEGRSIALEQLRMQFESLLKKFSKCQLEIADLQKKVIHAEEAQKVQGFTISHLRGSLQDESHNRQLAQNELGALARERALLQERFEQTQSDSQKWERRCSETEAELVATRRLFEASLTALEAARRDADGASKERDSLQSQCQFLSQRLDQLEQLVLADPILSVA
jgi:hypothetical protein